MRNTVDIDARHSLAILREVGEGLRRSYEAERELPASFKRQLERLRQSEDQLIHTRKAAGRR
jgi:hypothetical protein